MLLHDLFESTGMVTLYRGDASKVEAFSTEHTRNSISLLFGMGIYLTDNPRIALDYTVKGGFRVDGSGTVLVREQDTKEEAVRLFLNMIMARVLDWPKRREEMKTEWIQRWYDETKDQSRPSMPRYGEEPSPEYQEFKEREDAFNAEFRVALKQEMGKYLKRAKGVYKKQKLYAFQDTLGKWSIIHPNHEGHTSRFEIPEAYCRATLHGDRPLTDKELSVIKAFFTSMVAEGGRIDLRNKDNEFVPSWDEWIELFRKEGTRYAWSGHHVGGQGMNPSLDEIWNGTHGGTSIMYHKRDEFIAFMRGHGYNGIEYDGGKRLGVHVRGGGGIRHQSFVFWDDDYINSCRVEEAKAEYPELDVELGKIRTNAMSRRWVEPDKHGGMFSD